MNRLLNRLDIIARSEFNGTVLPHLTAKQSCVDTVLRYARELGRNRLCGRSSGAGRRLGDRLVLYAVVQHEGSVRRDHIGDRTQRTCPACVSLPLRLARYFCGSIKRLATMENLRHHRTFHNAHSVFHLAVTAMPWYQGLELDLRGVRYIEPELNVALILPHGRSLQWCTDLHKTAKSCAEFSQRDAATVIRWAEDFGPVVEKIIAPEAQSLPLPSDQRHAMLERLSLGRLLLAQEELSPVEFVDRDFEHDVVCAGLLFLNGLLRWICV